MTMSWWDGLWLNEGFASFMQNLAVDSIFPDYHIWDQWTIDSYAAAQRLDSLRSSHSVIVPIKHAEEVDQVFDAISYCKGSTVVKIVYTTLGHDKFRAGLQLYFKRHAYGNTETKDLWNAWSEVSGIDVSELMRLWTTRLGYPYISTVKETWSEKSVEVTLRQTWFLADGSLTEEEATVNPPVWHIPLLFRTAESTSDVAVIFNQHEQTFTIPLSKGECLCLSVCMSVMSCVLTVVAVLGGDDFLKINAGQKILSRVLYSREQLGRLQKALLSHALSPVDTASLVLDSYALAKANVTSIDDVIAVIKNIDVSHPNSDYIVWTALSGVLSGFNLLLENIGGEAAESFRSFAKGLVVKALGRVGW